MVSTVLVPVDFSETSDHALTWALKFASQAGTRIRLLHVLYGTDESWEEARETLEARVERVRAHEIPCDAELSQQKTEATILDSSKRGDVRWIVMGTHGRRGLRRVLLGSFAEETLLHAPVPVITVRPEVPVPDRIDHVVAGIDGTGRGPSVAGEVEAFVNACGCREVVLVNTWEPGYGGEPRTLPPPLTQLSERLGHRDVRCEIVAGAGRAEAQLLECAAKHDAQLLVVGAPLAGVGASLHASVARGLVRHAGSPVMVVPASSRRAQAK